MIRECGIVMVAVVALLAVGCAKREPATTTDPESPAAGTSSGDTSAADLLAQATAQGGTESFQALLKLRDHASPEMIPAIEQILIDHRGTGSTFGFGAAQVLFHIGTDEAHDVLRRHLLSPEYDATWGINYAFHWKMKEPQRSRFIEQYHLAPTSNGLKIELRHPDPPTGRPTADIKLGIEISNVSDGPIRLYKPRVYLGRMLVLRSADGRFIRSLTTLRYKLPAITEESFPELGPGQEVSLTIPCTVRVVAKDRYTAYGMPASQEASVVLDCGDMVHLLGKPGEYTVYAMYSRSQRDAEGQAKRLGLPAIWAGRVVSEPLQLTLVPSGETP